ncbi:hypothetical protein I552_9323 [Mycobacterium xenopi 3993]|nr:hypothetical protein I552_9323 [Mycobacterium xenopi 3993]
MRQDGNFTNRGRGAAGTDMEGTVADRDPDTIKQEIDQAREQLASTVDSLAARANPRRLAEDVKAQVISFVKKPVVTVSLVGIGRSPWCWWCAGSGIADRAACTRL